MATFSIDSIRRAIRQLETTKNKEMAEVKEKEKVALKKGDTVKVTHKPVDKAASNACGWAGDMDQTVGKIGTIREVGSADKCPIYVELDKGEGAWNYHEDYLLKLEPLKEGVRVRVWRGPMNEEERADSGWATTNVAMDATIGAIGVVQTSNPRTSVVNITDPKAKFSYANFLLERYFEIGDQVQVIRKPTDDEVEIIGWNDRMEPYTERHGVINDWDEELRAYQVKFDDAEWWYPPVVLDTFIDEFKIGEEVKFVREATTHEYRMLGNVEEANKNVGKIGKLTNVVKADGKGAHEAVGKLILDGIERWYPLQTLVKTATLKKVEKLDNKVKAERPPEKIVVGDIVEIYREPTATEADNIGGSRTNVKKNLGKIGEVVSMYAKTDLRVPAVKVMFNDGTDQLYCAEACVRKASKWKAKKYKGN